jgi:hypothetical protein
MRKITAIAVALGFLTSVSLPAYATPAVSGIVKSDELSGATKKKGKKAKKDEMKKGDLGTTDLSAKKKKSAKAKKKATELGATDLSAKKKKKSAKAKKKTAELGTTDLSARKKKSAKAKKNTEILYRIAA